MDVEKFVDADGDGIDDFAGLTRRLDYLDGLGVRCLWLQPFYPSPNRDNGHDVADFYNIHHKHGSLGELDEFMNHAHHLGMRVIVDLVVNHTSDRHPSRMPIGGSAPAVSIATCRVNDKGKREGKRTTLKCAFID